MPASHRESNTFLCEKYAIETNGVFFAFETNGAKNSETSVPLGNLDPHLIHECLSQPHSPPQTASGSIQPFCHSTLSGHTDRLIDRPTDGIDDSSIA